MVTEPRESRKLVTHPVGRLEKQTTPQRNASLEPMQPPWHRRLERQNQVQEKANQSNSNETPQAAAQN